jgi:hypothetical protein
LGQRHYNEGINGLTGKCGLSPAEIPLNWSVLKMDTIDSKPNISDLLCIFTMIIIGTLAVLFSFLNE